MSQVSTDPSIIPQRLYKGAPPQYVDEMLKCGRIRVGTLSEYRRIETEGVGDSNDGRREVQVPIHLADDTRFGDLPYPLNSFGFLHPDAIASFDFRNCTFDDSCPDALVYCTATSITGGRELYPAGVEIVDPLAFARLIDSELGARALMQGSFAGGRCVYVEHVQDFRELVDVPVAFQKETRFANQDEYRFVWQPTSQPAPVELEIPEIRALLLRAW